MKHFKQCKQVLLLIVLIVGLNSILCEERPEGLGVLKKFLSSQNATYQALEVINKNPIQLIRMRGFKAELHFVVTKDGYYIHLARIINPLVSPTAKLKRPVIFNHGLLESSTIWLINTQNVEPLPFDGQCGPISEDAEALNGTLYRNSPMMLANHGYDVWLMSMRGTDFSLHNDNLTPLDSDFWDYSLDDFALKDVPAVVDYVRAKTGEPKVGYIGHSQATFSVFALLATYPSYADLIEPIVAVAPVAHFHHTTSLARPLFLATLTATDNNFNGPFPPQVRSFRNAISKFCTTDLKSTPPQICAIIEALISGKGEGWLKGYYNHLPFMTSLKILRHFGILIKSKQFQRYDYGSRKNIKLYGSRKAPIYKVDRINSKSLCLISTRSDALSAKGDVDLFRKKLRVPLYRDVFIDQNFDHFDLIVDRSAGKLVNKPILEIFESIEAESGICYTAQEREQFSDNHDIELI